MLSEPSPQHHYSCISCSFCLPYSSLVKSSRGSCPIVYLQLVHRTLPVLLPTCNWYVWLPADTPARGFNLWPKMTMIWQHFIKTDTNNFYWAVTKRKTIMIGIAKKWLRFIYVYEVTFTGDEGALKNLRRGPAKNRTCCTHSL